MSSYRLDFSFLFFQADRLSQDLWCYEVRRHGGTMSNSKGMCPSTPGWVRCTIRRILWLHNANKQEIPTLSLQIFICISKYYVKVLEKRTWVTGRTMGNRIAVRYGRLDIYWRWLISVRRSPFTQSFQGRGVGWLGGEWRTKGDQDQKTNLQKY